MHSHAIAAQHDLDKAGTDQGRQMLRSAGVDDHRSGDDHHFSASLADSLKLPRDLTDHEFDFAFAADSGPHKREFGGRRRTDSTFLAGFALTHRLDPIDSDDYSIAAPQIAHQPDR